MTTWTLFCTRHASRLLRGWGVGSGDDLVCCGRLSDDGGRDRRVIDVGGLSGLSRARGWSLLLDILLLGCGRLWRLLLIALLNMILGILFCRVCVCGGTLRGVDFRVRVEWILLQNGAGSVMKLHVLMVAGGVELGPRKGVSLLSRLGEVGWCVGIRGGRRDGKVGWRRRVGSLIGIVVALCKTGEVLVFWFLLVVWLGLVFGERRRGKCVLRMG